MESVEGPLLLFKFVRYPGSLSLSGLDAIKRGRMNGSLRGFKSAKRVAFPPRLAFPLETMEIIGLQWNLAWEKKEANFARVAELLAAAAPDPGALVVLPEMFATGFSMNAAAIAEDPDGESFSFLASLAREFGVYLLAGVVTKSGRTRGFNEAVVIDPEGKEAARYRKMHPFRYAGEGDFYDPGSAPVLWRWDGVAVAPFICYDLRFPEIFRLAAGAGAELFVVIANWPSARVEHWRLLLRARAIENQAYVLGVNRCGSDPNLAYPGATLIVDPMGNIVEELNGSEGVMKVDLDPALAGTVRQNFPFLRDLRRELFRAD